MPKDATLTQALVQVRDRDSLLRGLLDGELVFWLGSGISRDQYPGLDKLLKSLLEALYAKSDLSNASCGYMATLKRIVGMTTVKAINYGTSPSHWAELDELINQLWDKYSLVLNEYVSDKGTKLDLFWDLLKLQDVYGDTAIPPGTSHRLLALLIEEGVVPSIVTTNWDPLIEKAHAECSNGHYHPLTVVACNDDLTQATGTRLLKIHGCAVLACNNAAKYKPFLVASKTHFSTWNENDIHRPFRDYAVNLLRLHPTLFVGLSGQDENIQAGFVASVLGKSEHFPISTMRALFSEMALSPHQRGLLSHLYGPGYQGELDDSSAIGLFASELLGALYFLTILAKVKAINARCLVPRSTELDAICSTAITDVETSLCTRYDAIPNTDQRWAQLASELPAFVSRLLQIYRKSECAPNPLAYEPLRPTALPQLTADEDLPSLRLDRLILALALLAEGHKRGTWEVASPLATRPSRGQLSLDASTPKPVDVFLLRDPIGMVKLLTSGVVDATSPTNVVVVYPNAYERAASRTTSPSRRLPHSGSPPFQEVWLESLLDEQLPVNQLFDALNTSVLRAKLP